MLLAFKLLRPQGQRSELILFLSALVIAIASVSAVSLVADRLNQALQISSRDYIAADRVISSSETIPEAWLEKAKEDDLNIAKTVRFNSMLFANDQFQLASVRAVDNAYPLRGDLELSPAQAVKPGQIWLSAQLMSLMRAKIGDPIEIGNMELTVSGTLIKEPDAGFSVFNLAPSALMHWQDVKRAGVIQPGSRASWRYLFAGEEGQLLLFSQWLEPQLNDNQKFYGADQGDTPVAQPLQRAARFFMFSALVGVLLGALAMAITLRHYAQAQFDNVALLKTLGATSSQIRKIFWSLLGLIIVIGSVVGLGLGWLSQLLLLASLGDLIPENLPMPSIMPLLLIVVLAILLTIITAYVPLNRLLKTPPLRVLRRDISERGHRLSAYILFVLGPLLLVWLVSGDLLLSLVLLASFSIVMVLVGAMSWLFIMFANATVSRGALHLALLRLRRHRLQSMTQLAGMATSLLLMALIINLQDDLSYIWQQRLPDNAANRFMLNIAPNDVDKLRQTLKNEAVEVSDVVPMLRARVSAVNGFSLQEWFDGEPPERIAKERNLTWLTTLPAGNEIVDGEWWQGNDKPGISLEQGYAERLQATLGDMLTFSVGGREVTAPVTSIRTVAWETMQPNFFIVFSPGLLTDFPATYLASFHLSAEQYDKESRIVHQFPSASVINIDSLISQLGEVIDKVSKALSLMVSLVIIAAILVMLALLQVSMSQRKQELVLMRTLGAPSVLMRQALRWELLITGAIAGLVAVISVEIAGWLLSYFWLDVPMRLHYLSWVLLPVLGALLSILSGSMQLKPIINNVLSQKIKAF